MAKQVAALLVAFLLTVTYINAQSPAIKLPPFSGNVNDWESLFTDAQKLQLDSACTVFIYQTNIPIAVVTFGAANTTKADADEFIQKADSMYYQYSNAEKDMAIFLSKEFRVLSFKASNPQSGDTSTFNAWKVKLQGIFSACAQPYIPLLKDGKYAEALIATIKDLAVAVKKEL